MIAGHGLKHWQFEMATQEVSHLLSGGGSNGINCQCIVLFAHAPMFSSVV